MTEDMRQKARDAYSKAYGGPPECLAFAPGRVEILGNHTDYNGGYVLSVALDLGIWIAAGRSPARPSAVEVWSQAMDQQVTIPLDAIRKERSWADYPRGVLLEMQRAGAPLGSARLAVLSTLPIGAGVSSSAALELATAEAAHALFGGKPAQPMEEAKLCQRAEVSFVGMPCGLLDQFSSLFGKKDHALFLDCATLRNMQVPLGRGDIRLVLADSGEKHALVDGKYASLRRSCERAAAKFADLLDHEVRFLRDVSLAEFQLHAELLESEDRPRAEHVIRENERVLRGLAAIRSKHFPEVTRMMLESHASSRDLFGNSTPALDYLVECGSQLPGFLGGKLCGGGFGGSTVNLVTRDQEEGFSRELSARFEKKFGRVPQRIACGIGDGARSEKL